MADEIYALLKADVDELRQALTNLRNQSINSMQRPANTQAMDCATNTYLVLVPAGGIPPMTAGTVANSLGVPGYAYCQVIQQNNTLVPPQLFLVGSYFLNVWNYTPETVEANTVVPVVQTAYGEWVPVGTQMIFHGTGTGTGTGGEGITSIVGTAHQILVSIVGTTATLSTPQNIDTSSSMQLNTLLLSGTGTTRLTLGSSTGFHSTQKIIGATTTTSGAQGTTLLLVGGTGFSSTGGDAVIQGGTGDTGGFTGGNAYLEAGNGSSGAGVVGFKDVTSGKFLTMQTTTVTTNRTYDWPDGDGQVVLQILSSTGIAVAGPSAGVYTVSLDATYVLPPSQGGTGVNNGSSTITLAGGHTLTLTLTGNTNITLPTSGTPITGLVYGTTTLTGGTAGLILADGGGTLTGYGAVGTGTTLALATSPTFGGTIQTSIGSTLTINGEILVPNPVNPTDAVNLQTLTAAIEGLDAKPQVAYCSTAPLPTNAYLNGISGVGATLTATANGFLVIDGVTTIASDSGLLVLVAGESTQANNGWYTITTPGSLVAKYVLTRTPGSDIAGDIGPGYITGVSAPTAITPGVTNNGKAFISFAPSPFVVGTSAITYATVGNSYTADETSIHLSGTTFSVKTTWTGQAAITTVGTLTTGATGAGFTIALTTSTVTGLLPTANGGTGVSSSASTGIAHVASGTWTFSTIVTADIADGAVTDNKLASTWKPIAKGVAIANVTTLSGTQSINGVSFAANDLILLTAQTTSANNGPWVVASGAWTRPTWFATGNTVQCFTGIVIQINQATAAATYSGSSYYCTTTGTITIGTTSTTWLQLMPGMQIATLNSGRALSVQKTTGSSVFKFVLPFSNFSAAVAPTVGNDNTQGYCIGSVWCGPVLGASYYVCRDNSPGAAVWTLIPGAVAGADLFNQTSTGGVTVVSFTTSGNDGTYRIGGWVNITAISGASMTFELTWTDETNTLQTYDMQPILQISLGSSQMTNTGWYLFPDFQLRALGGGTTIKLATLFSGGGTISYDIGGTIEQLR